MATANLKLPLGADMDSEITSRILKIVTREKVCHLDDLVEKCDDYTWNQVFIEVDRLSRIGGLRLLYQKGGDYAVSLASGRLIAERGYFQHKRRGGRKREKES